MPSRVKIFDPFVGNGTTLEAAAAVGVEAYGVELNPYSALLSRCRVSTGAQIKSITDIYRTATAPLKKARSSKTAQALPTPSAMVESLIRAVATRATCAASDLLHTLCLRANNDLDSEVVALVAALHVLKKQAAVHYRSNPAWLIQGYGPDRAEDVEPPLNRLDYVNPTIPELHVLGWQEGDRLNDLRSQMMGTTKMRRQLAATQLSSLTANKLLAAIADHPTKASGTYYLKFFRQYFEDTVEFFRWLRGRSTPTCKGIVVIQDSFYKEIKVPIVKILAELALDFDFTVEVLLEEKRIRHMGTLSPHQRTHAPNKALTEYTLLFSRMH